MSEIPQSNTRRVQSGSLILPDPIPGTVSEQAENEPEDEPSSV